MPMSSIEFDKKTKRYRDKRGRFVSKRSVRDAVSNIEKTFKRDAERLAKQWNDGELTQSAWLKEMASLVKSNLIVTASIGKGGRKQMTKSDWGLVGAKVRREYHYLRRFANAMDRLSPLQIVARAKQYAAAGFIAFSSTLHKVQRGFATEAKRFLHARESCSDCRSYAGEWMPIADMPGIGTLMCGHRCRCHIEYR